MRGIRCAPGVYQKDGIGLFWKSVGPQQAVRHARPARREGQELFHRLLHVSDVLVVNNRPSTLARWGLDYESVHRAHPHLVMLHVTGYGGGGPASDRPGFGTLGRGHERVRPRHGPARRPPDAAPVLPGRRHRGPVGHVRRDDGALPPRPARRLGPAHRREPGGTAGPPHRDVHAGLQPPRGGHGPHGNRLDASARATPT